MSQRNLRPFVLLQAASFVSLVSGSMTFMLMPWIAIQLTGSAVNAGLMVTITSIPGLILSPVMGGFIDRYGRRRVAILSELGSAVMNLVIAVLAAMIGLSLPALIAIAIIKTIVGSGALTKTERMIEELAEESLAALELLELDSYAKAQLQELALKVINRAS